MSSNSASAVAAVKPDMKKHDLRRRILKNKAIYLMILPGLLYFVLFKYFPMWGLVISFQEYRPYDGILGSDWVGFKHYQRLFTEPMFWTIFRNTIVLFLMNLIFFFPVPIILAILLNEVRLQAFKRFVQTIVYIPHFMSWVIIVSISFVMVTMDGGMINEGLMRWACRKSTFC